MKTAWTEKLKKYVPVINKTIALAEELARESKEKFDSEVNVTFTSLIESFGITGKEKELNDYLMEQDYETIKVMQTIMYIGRDCLPDESGLCNYDEERAFSDDQGWNEDKWVEVHQMVSKIPLPEYLKSGCVKIGLELKEH